MDLDSPFLTTQKAVIVSLPSARGLFDQLDDSEKAFAHHVSRASWILARKALGSEERSRLSIYDMIIALENEWFGNYHMLAGDADVAVEAVRGYLEYAALFLSSMSCRSANGADRIVPSISGPDFKKIVETSAPAMSHYRLCFRDILPDAVVDETQEASSAPQNSTPQEDDHDASSQSALQKAARQATDIKNQQFIDPSNPQIQAIVQASGLPLELGKQGSPGPRPELAAFLSLVVPIKAPRHGDGAFQPVHVQPNTFLDGAEVRLVEYAATPKGVIRSFSDRRLDGL